MNWFKRLRVVTRKEETARELDEELQFHIDRQIEENLAAGMSAAEARRAALRDFGMLEAVKDECRSARGMDYIEDLVQDVRHALRDYRRSPGFALAVIALMAVGIGATTAVFSFVDRVLFRGLPYADSGRLVSLGIRIPWLEYDFLTASSYGELRRRPGPFAALTSSAGVADCDVTGDRPVRLSCASVESSFLPVLGIGPELGRNFTREEDQANAAPVALISHALWQNRFGGDPGIVGRRMPLDGQQVLITGVLPENFELPALDVVDILRPQALPANLPPGARPLRIYGRLRQGVTVGEARGAILAQASALFTEIPPDVRKHVQFHVRTLRDLQTGDFRTASWLLLGAVLAMLLIACANAANLLLARSVARQRELAIRVALGAGRARLARQMLAESLLLSAAGGAAGCLLAYALLKVFVAIAPAGIPHLAGASLDARVLLFGVAVSLVCGTAFGLVPALYTPKPEALTGGRSTARASLTARQVLVGAQVAVSLVLLTCAGALLQSLWNRQSIALGVRADGVVTAQLSPGARYAQPVSRAALYERLEARLERVPDIGAAALSDSLPPGGVPRSQPIFAPFVEDKPPLDQTTPGIVVWRTVTPGYFRAMEIRILRGRGFTEADRTPTSRAIIISDSYARRLFGAEDPIGRRMCRFPVASRDQAIWYTIVGVASDARNAGLTDGGDPEYYLVRRHGGTAWEDAPHVTTAIVRGAPVKAIAALLRTEIAALDPALPPPEIRTFESHLARLAARPRFQAWLLALFAGVGALLAALGLYGLVAFLVVEREREFGIRLALGATPGAVVRMILGDSLRWTAAGLVAGLAGAAAASLLLRSILFHVSPGDPAAYLAAAALLVALALGAALLPSRRVSRLDPANSLRQD
jgi:putative ABC transport system permease protein